jgi:hypothetical protein
MRFFTKDEFLFEMEIPDLHDVIVPTLRGNHTFSCFNDIMVCTDELTEEEKEYMKKWYKPLQWKQQDYLGNIGKRIVEPLEEIKKALIKERSRLIEEKKKYSNG